MGNKGRCLEKKKVLIVYGGKSTEHDISIITAVTIFKKYKLPDVELVMVYQNKVGEWFIGEGLDDFTTYKNFNGDKFERVTFLEGDKWLYRTKKNKFVPLFEIDFVVNCFHGGAGEDGRFSGFLEGAKIPSSSSSYKALGVAMDKYLTKLVALSLDVPVVDFFSFSQTEWTNAKEKVLQQVNQFDFPVIVKPVNQGSSIGVSFANTLDEFNTAVNLGFKFDENLMVERAIINKREFNCCLVKTSEGKIIARVDEPVSDKVVISFKDKYLSGGSAGKSSKLKISGSAKESFGGMETVKRKSQLGIPSKVRSFMIKNSRMVYDSLDMNGVVRFDFLFDTKKERLYLGEINAVPGSLGYYFFEGDNLLKLVYDAGKIYWNKRFCVNIVEAPTVFS